MIGDKTPVKSFRLVARGGSWGEPVDAPDVAEVYLKLTGDRLFDDEGNIIAGADPVPSGGLEGQTVYMHNGWRVWFGGTNGWDIEAPWAMNETGSDRYREINAANLNKPRPELVCPRCEIKAAERDDSEHPGLFACSVCGCQFTA